MTLRGCSPDGYAYYVEYGTGHHPHQHPWLEYDHWEARDRTLLEAAAARREYHLDPPDEDGHE